MKIWLLLALITLSEASIGVFVKLTDGRIPVQTLTFYAFVFATAFLMLTIPRANKKPLELPRGNWKDIIVSPAVATLLGFLIFNEVPAASMLYGGVLLLGAGGSACTGPG